MAMGEHDAIPNTALQVALTRQFRLSADVVVPREAKPWAEAAAKRRKLAAAVAEPPNTATGALGAAVE